MTVIIERPAVLAAEIVGITWERTRSIGVAHCTAVDVISKGVEIAIDSGRDRNRYLVLLENTASFVLVDIARGVPVWPRPDGTAEIIEGGRQRSIDISCQELVEAASVRIGHR